MKNIPDFGVAGFVGGTASLNQAAAGRLNQGVRMFAGFPFRTMRGPFGKELILPPESINGGQMLARAGAGGTAITQDGGQLTFTGTVSHPTPTSTSYYDDGNTVRLTSAATIGSQVGWRSGTYAEYKGSQGYICVQSVSLDTLVTGARGLFGISNSIAAPAAIDPIADTTISKVGIGFNTNTGNFQFIHNLAGSVPTTFDMGANFPVNTTDSYHIYIHNPPNGDITVEVFKLSLTDGSYSTPSYSRTITTNRPTNPTAVGRYANMSNNAQALSVAASFNTLANWRY
jgi:hypothetical protein